MDGPLPARLVPIGLEGRQPFNLTAGEALIGRQSESMPVDIDLTEYPGGNYISRRHARVWRARDGHYWVEDLGSTAGTFYESPDAGESSQVSGPTRLSNRGLLRFGAIEFIFRAATVIAEQPVALPKAADPSLPFAAPATAGRSSGVFASLFNLRTLIWAVVPLELLVLATLLGPINFEAGSYSGDLTQLMSEGSPAAAYENNQELRRDLVEARAVGSLAALILPFGMKITTRVEGNANELLDGASYGFTNLGGNITLRSSTALGFSAVFIGCLLVGWLTQRSRLALFIAAPLSAYAGINLVWINAALAYAMRRAEEEDGTGLSALMTPFVLPQIEMFPFLWQALLAIWTAALLAFIVLQYLGRQQFVELADSGPTNQVSLGNLFTDGDLPSQLNLSPAGSPLLQSCLACPFCGAPQRGARVPKQCGICKRALSMIVEPVAGKVCAACHAYLVPAAHFCQRCGSVQAPT